VVRMKAQARHEEGKALDAREKRDAAARRQKTRAEAHVLGGVGAQDGGFGGFGGAFGVSFGFGAKVV